jgi:hypothetical protein
MDIQETIKMLRKEASDYQEKASNLNHAADVLETGTVLPVKKVVSADGKRHMSPEAKARISAAQKVAWAERRKSKQIQMPLPETSILPSSEVKEGALV